MFQIINNFNIEIILNGTPGGEVATCSSILAWEILWTGAYSLWGHKRARHNLATEQQQILCLSIPWCI